MEFHFKKKKNIGARLDFKHNEKYLAFDKALGTPL